MIHLWSWVSIKSKSPVFFRKQYPGEVNSSVGQRDQQPAETTHRRKELVWCQQLSHYLKSYLLKPSKKSKRQSLTEKLFTEAK